MSLRASKSRFAAAPLVVLSALAWGCTRAPAKPRRPNVLLIVVDCMRGDRLGVNGYAKPLTPHIDALAAEGVSFTHAFAQGTWTKPSVATLLTSVYPSSHGLIRVGFEGDAGFATDVLDEHLVTLAEAYSRNGYATAGVVNQVHLQPQYGFAQGFDAYRASRGARAQNLNRRFLRWLPTIGDKPWFAYIHYLDVHWPYTLRVPGGERFGSIEMDSTPPADVYRVNDWAKTGISDKDVRALAARYDQEVASVDAAVGDLVARLDKQKMLGDTILVLTADHGEGFFEHRNLMHGFAPYDEVTHVPLVIRFPAWMRPKPGLRHTLVGLIDVMPTLLDLAGVQAEPQCQGTSLKPYIAGQEDAARAVYTETDVARAVRTSTAKLILWTSGQREFYDLDRDPGERTDLGASCGGAGETACAKLATLLKAFAERHATSLVTEHKPDSVTMDPSDVEELKSLGYLGQ